MLIDLIKCYLTEAASCSVFCSIVLVQNGTTMTWWGKPETSTKWPIPDLNPPTFYWWIPARMRWIILFYASVNGSKKTHSPPPPPRKLMVISYCKDQHQVIQQAYFSITKLYMKVTNTSYHYQVIYKQCVLHYWDSQLVNLSINQCPTKQIPPYVNQLYIKSIQSLQNRLIYSSGQQSHMCMVTIYKWMN